MMGLDYDGVGFLGGVIGHGHTAATDADEASGAFYGVCGSLGIQNSTHIAAWKWDNLDS